MNNPVIVDSVRINGRVFIDMRSFYNYLAGEMSNMPEDALFSKKDFFTSLLIWCNLADKSTP